MYKIQTNSSGTRSIDISEDHLQTIEDYQLFRDLIDSNGYVDEQVLDKLKLNIRSLLGSEAGKDKRLLDLCLDVIYHANMKAFRTATVGVVIYQLEKPRKQRPGHDNPRTTRNTV